MHFSNHLELNSWEKSLLKNHIFWASGVVLDSLDKLRWKHEMLLIEMDHESAQYNTLIEEDHLVDWSSEKDNSTPIQPVLLRNPFTQMIFFNRGMLLLDSSHFLWYNTMQKHGEKNPKATSLTMVDPCRMWPFLFINTVSLNR